MSKQTAKSKIKAKERYLSKYLELKYEVMEQEMEASFWHEKAYSIPAVNFLKFEGSKTNAISHHNPIDRFLEIADRCMELASKANEKRAEIKAAIDQLDNRKHRLVLSLKYINDMENYAIAEELHYSESHVRRLIREAIKRFEIPKQDKDDQ